MVTVVVGPASDRPTTSLIRTDAPAHQEVP
jgi:hypothetical protein